MGDDDRQLKYINVGMEFTNKVTKKILKNLDEDEQEEQLAMMRDTMRNYIRMEYEYKISKDVLAKIKKGLEVESANVDMDKDIEADYRTHYQADLEKEGLTDAKIESDHRYKQLESIIAGNIANTSGDDDLMVTGDDQVFIDPWSRRNIEDPVTNKKCGHHYEKAVVFRQVETAIKKRKTLKCPYVGCGNDNITKNDLQVDNEIKRKIARQNRSK